jgi:soluble lytic murein transglycosylase
VQPRCLGFAVLFLSIFNSCSAQTVLRLPLREAKERLRSGNVQFILDGAPEKLKELARIDSAAPFYAALHLEAAKNAGETKEKRIILFTEALKSPHVRAAAIKKLAALDRDAFLLRFGGELRSADGGGWAQALRLFRDAPAYKEALPGALRDDLYAFYFREPAGESQRWLDAQFRTAFAPPPQEEYSDDEDGDDGADGGDADDERGTPDAGSAPPAWWNTAGALIAGRLAASRSLWGEALWQLRFARERGEDAVFIKYPELLSDLGKAFQYSAPAAGLRAFLEWEKRLQKAKGDGVAEARYRLLFFAGRMARQVKKSEEAVGLFDRAAALAPDAQQKDACIWYLLDTRMRVKEENLSADVEKYAAQWADGAYFADILDKFSAWAAKKRNWNLIRRVFKAINGYADPETQAKYAYICGRALEYGFLKKQNAKESAAFYYKIAYGEDASARQNLAAIYYRALAAKRLGRPLGIDALFALEGAAEAPPAETAALPAAADSAAAMEITADERARQEFGVFFDGFFEFGCAPYLYPYIREVRDELGVDELRSLAGRLHEAKEWQSGINVALYVTRRPDYQPARGDVELSYPLGYKELLEKQAEKAGIESALLFALVRRESVFNAQARSRVGALGLTQLMEKTGTEMARQLARRGGADYFFAGTVNLLDPEINTNLGALYYRQLLDATSSPVTAILSYNGGIGRLRRWRKAAAELSDDLFLETVELTETRTYGRGVLGDEIIYRYLYDL